MELYEKIYLYRRIVQAKLFIDGHFADDIELDHIAGAALFSKFHFIRLFKSMYGKTPHHYLRKVRIDNARLLLARGIPVADAGSMVGFASPTSFSAVFKSLTGKTPSAFQAEQRIRAEAIGRNPLAAVPNCFAQSHAWTEIAISERRG